LAFRAVFFRTGGAGAAEVDIGIPFQYAYPSP